MTCRQRPKSKRDMIAALHGAPSLKASLPMRNTLDYIGADGLRRIRLHQTDILTFKKRGGFVIDTGGWNTHTTRNRLNAFLPAGYRVGTSRGRLYLFGRCAGPDIMPGSREFRQRIKVTAKGIAKPDVSGVAADRLTKQIDAYMTAWRKRGLPKAEESGGDPWVFGSPKVDEHVMLDWIKSRYVHRRLYSLVLEYAGVRPEGIAIRLHMADTRGMDKRDFGRIRRYIRACVGLAA